MPKKGGLDAIIEIQKSDPEAKLVMFTSSSRKDEVVAAKIKCFVLHYQTIKNRKFLSKNKRTL